MLICFMLFFHISNSLLPKLSIDMDCDFYRSFNLVICGLDSILARRWINGMLLSLLEYDEQTNSLDQSTVIPLIDGGTEGIK